MNSIEKWKDIEEYEGLYQISSLGRVKSLEKVVPNGQGGFHRYPERILQTKGKTQRYDLAGLCKNGKVCFKTVHRLVAIAFVPNPNNKPHINHKDGKKKNNWSSNLEWCTPSENIRHADANGLRIVARGEKNHFSKLTENIVLEILRRVGNKEVQRYIAKDLGVHESLISMIKHGHIWKHLTRRGRNDG